MELANRKDSLIKLGYYIAAEPDSLAAAVRLAGIKNHWFTEDNCYKALRAISQHMLSREALENWLEAYDLDNVTPKRIGIIAAGNIPLVSFHDILCTLIAGHVALIKLSDKDNVLLPHLLQQLITIDPAWKDHIITGQRWENYDAVIATGSNNTSRYFDYYFGKYPHIIRKNRHSVAVLNGRETPAQLYELGKDVFEYFGLGCRNVSLIWLPQGYQFETLIAAWQPFSELMHFHSYKNNLDYQRTLFLMNGTPIIDCDFVNMVDVTAISSPISCVNLAYYKDLSEVDVWLQEQDDAIQCVVNHPQHPRAVSIGAAQEPGLCDYADGVDTLQFLLNL